MSYLKKRTVEESIQLVERLALICKNRGGPLTLQVYNLLMEGRYAELLNFHIDYTWCFSSDDFLYCRQILGFVEKQDFLKLGFDREGAAYERFLQSEDMCRETNMLFEDLSSLNWDVSAVLYYASQKIEKILGDIPSLDSLDMSFGPGANTSTNSLISNPRIKMSSRLECSMNLVPIAQGVLEQLPELAAAHTDMDPLLVFLSDSYLVDVVVAPGKLAFVPKNCKTHRSIVVEPSLNGLVQKGIGKLLKERLLIAGIDLSTQENNQNAARKGSIAGTLATIDLSMASDCLSRGLVWNLLPTAWAELLDYARTPVVTYENRNMSTHLRKTEYFALEKFSSMGNAYTFELETLIFYSLAWGVCSHLKIRSADILVYGDDIIVPVEAYGLLEKVLNTCGFKLNASKSFCAGPFRESCGADYLNGIDIRPFYLTTLISDRVLYNMHNWFIRHCEFELAAAVLQETHEPDRLYGPDGYGDGHLIGDWNPRKSRMYKRNGYDGGCFDTYTLKPQSFKKRLKNDHVFPCYSIYVRDPGGPSNVLDSPTVETDDSRIRGTRGYAKISIYTLARGLFTRNTGV